MTEIPVGNTSWQVLTGDCRDVLRTLPERSVHTVITSPPYFGLRDYGTGEWDGGNPDCRHSTGTPMRTNAKPTVPHADRGPTTFHGGGTRAEEFYRDRCDDCGATRVDRQIGLEPTPDEFVQALVEVFRDVRRVLRDDGTVWLNLGDSYAGGGGGNYGNGKNVVSQGGQQVTNVRNRPDWLTNAGVKAKDLIGVPWMVAFALRSDGWYLRSDVIWAKPNPMPESVTDRPTKAHEYVFLLSKGPRYFYDADAIREDDSGQGHPHRNVLDGQPSLEPSNGLRSAHGGLRTIEGRNGAGRNKRSVWTIATQPYAGAHFATFPPKLIEPCVLAGCPERCCSACGAPWERVVKRETTARDEPGVPQGEWSENGVQRHRAATRAGDTSSRTLGWMPSCSCGLVVDGASEYENQLAAEQHAAVKGMDAQRDLNHPAAWRVVPKPDAGAVLDPFAGVGTTGVVALRHNRSFIGVELNAEYADMARDRIRDDAPLLNGFAELA